MNKPSALFNLAIAGVQHLSPYIPGKPVEELERELGLSNIVKLASNENPLGPSPTTIRAIQANTAELTRYPDGSGFHLKQALAEKYQLSSSQITLGNGSNELLELVARTFLTTAHSAVFSQHAFAVYPIVTQAIGAKAIVVPALNYGHDLDAMLKSITPQTRLVFIANPNNPTGTVLPQAKLQEFIKALPPTVVCVLDEAYYEFVSAEQQGDAVAWLDACPNLLITRTFSKAYGLAGLRIGYGLSSTDLADLLNRVRQPFNNNSLALAAAEAALADTDYLQQTILLNQQGMQQLTNAFKALGLEWIPSAGNFVAVDLKLPAQAIYSALLAKGVIVRPVANYELPNHLRVSIGTAAENQTFIDALTAVLANV
ncbi:MAG: histidinol-phosphate transaminase [Methylococcales bacterium]